jgi:hypothetical protein
MGAFRRFASRLVSLVRPHHHDAALAREVASHLFEHYGLCRPWRLRVWVNTSQLALEPRVPGVAHHQE